MQGLKGVIFATATDWREGSSAEPADRHVDKEVRRTVLGPVEALLLRSVQNLGHDRAYGAEIQRHIAALIGKRITLGQIYTTLDRLEAKNLIRSYKTNPEPIRGGRTKRVFQLEERGVRALEEAAALYTINNSNLSNGDIYGAPIKSKKIWRSQT